MKKAIPIGYEDLKEIIDKNLYYVDKTLMLRELIDRPAKVNLFTRPRRFGKTLNLSMIQRFFEMEPDSCGSQAECQTGCLTGNGYLFKGLKISECGEEYMAHQGCYPVISLSLKSAKQPDYGMAYEALVNEIIAEYKRHHYLVNSPDILEADKEKYNKIIHSDGSPVDYATALAFLSACLEKHHQKKAIILIDEYDVPLENAYFAGFYDKMVAFVRSLFESALKTNPHLEFAVITGCLRISRESIFTGLNNLAVYSVQSVRYAGDFGFTETEVQEMLSYYGLADKFDELRRWYDGYQFGKTEIYNPWSVLHYADSLLADPDAFPQPYWSNTSSNSIIRELVEQADMETRQEIEALVAGDTVEKPVHEEITYGDIHQTRDNLWNFLYFTGYLRKNRERMVEESLYLEFSIPNQEVRIIYRNTILSWFRNKISTYDFSAFYQAVMEGNAPVMEEHMKGLLRESISFYDSQEKFYHGFLLGLLSGLQNYQIKSNRESGDGRPDILLLPYDEQEPAVIMELKTANRPTDMVHRCEEAQKQITERCYAEELAADGYENIITYGICFCRKTCKVRLPFPADLQA